MLWAYLTPIAAVIGLFITWRTFRCEILRLRRNRFNSFASALFSMKKSYRTFLTMQVFDAVFLIALPVITPSRHGSMPPNVVFYALVGTAGASIVFIIIAYFEVLFRALSDLRRRGLLRDMELADLPLQNVCCPAWPNGS